MIEFKNPPNIIAPTGPYSQVALTHGAGKWLWIAGQIGASADGAVPDSFEEQAELAWRNVISALSDAQMGLRDVVHVTTYLVDRDDLALLAPIRLKYLDGARPASTLLLVAALGHPTWRIELQVVAFQAEVPSVRE